MRVFWYIILFITPTVLVLIYRTEIQDFLGDKGIIRRPPGQAGSAGPKATPPQVPDRGPGTKALPDTASTPPTTPPANTADQDDESFDLEINTKYPLPKFKPLEDVVGNWQNVPSNAFPEIVTLKQPVELSLIIASKVSGKSMLKVGQSAYPIGLKGSTLTISGSPGERGTKGTIGIDDTDFKQQVNKKYNDWKARQTARVHKLRKDAKKRLLAEKSSSKDPSATANPASLGDEPKRSPDGSVAVMMSSIKAGQVKEIQLDKIQYWQWLGKDTVGGKDYWAGVVGYVANTIFGEINTEGKALIRNGKVVKWVYSGSEEAIK